MINFIFNQCCPETPPGFFEALLHYLIEVGPALLIGFLLSGIINEFVPEEWVEKHLGGKGIKPILLATLIGSILPICCWGSLPLAVSFQKKGARLGPVLAFLVATPGTSISAVLVTWSVLGLKFAVYIFIAVIIMGIVMGLIGNMFSVSKVENADESVCHCCCEAETKKTLLQHILSILKFAFVDMVKDIGLETAIGLVIAAIVASFDPVGRFVKLYLGGFSGYVFALVFGILMYICATSSPPMVDAFIGRGLSSGAGMTMLLVGPITSYGTILVINKKFGFRVLFSYLFCISLLSLFFGYLFSVLS
ncbi:MAG: permease [candidate division WOR-3 bacterium]|nr:permease [candidate division WOR-3 bacterium]